MSRLNTGIYLITNNSNKHLYVGSAINTRTRLRHHRHRLTAQCHRNGHLQHAWNKHGADSFEFRVLLYCDRDNLLLYEQRAINIFLDRRERDALYNLDLVAGSALGRKHSEETKAKMSIAARGNQNSLGAKRSEEFKQAISERMTGKPSPLRGRTLPEETKRKISETLMGHTHSPETRSKIGTAGRGRKLSDESRARMSANNARYFLGRHHTEETEAKISAAKAGQVPWIKGRKHTEEAKAKMRAAKQRGRMQKADE